MKAESKPALWPSPRLDLARHRKDELKPLKCICVHHGARCHGGPGALDVERKTCHMWCTIALRPMVGPLVMVFPLPGLGRAWVCLGSLVLLSWLAWFGHCLGSLVYCHHASCLRSFLLFKVWAKDAWGWGVRTWGLGGRGAPGRRRSANREPGSDIVVCYSHLLKQFFKHRSKALMRYDNTSRRTLFRRAAIRNRARYRRRCRSCLA